MSEPRLCKNDVISCPTCCVEVADVVRDCYTGEIMDATMFRGREKDLQNGDLCLCRNCGDEWAMGERVAIVHVQGKGWR